MGLANDLSTGGIVWSEETQVPPVYNSYWPLETKNGAEIVSQLCFSPQKQYVYLSIWANLG